MTRTNRRPADTSKSGKRGDASAGRKSQISRAMSKLLRHQAENESIPISPAGWVQLDHLLAWKGLNRIGQDITVSEIFEVVEEDGRTGKGRFQVKAVKGNADKEMGGTLDESVADLSITAPSSDSPSLSSATDSTVSLGIDPSSKNTLETQLTLLYHSENPDHPPSMYLIRASQGHSMSSVQSADLLSPITLSDPSTIPDTVVHGTFYGAWPLILASGGLKSMGRNNVHFATGPALNEVLAIVGNGEENSSLPSSGGMKTKSQVDSVLSENKVISGMRWDAQLLIYIDLKRCLEDVASNRLDMTWWKSGNGVILTEGVAMSDHNSGQDNPETGVDAPPILASKHAKQQRAAEIAATQDNPDTSMSPQPSAEVPIIASKHAKAQRAQEILSQDASEPPAQAREQPSRPEVEEVIPIIASKHAKAQYAAQQQQQQQQAPTPPPAATVQTPPTIPTDNPPLLASTSAKQQFARQQSHRPQRLVPMKYVSAVVEIKNGVGVIWRHGEGEVRELPDRLRNLPVPRGKNRVHGAGKGQGRARLNVERDDMGGVDDDDVQDHDQD